jgi:hypothetical protein
LQLTGRRERFTLYNPDFTLLDQFAKGLELLDDYDHEKLDPKGITTRQTMYPVLTDNRKIIERYEKGFRLRHFWQGERR